MTPDIGGGPVVVVYDGAKLARGLTGEAAQFARFFGIDDPTFRGGARAAVGEMTGDGVPDVIVAAGSGGGPRVTVWDGAGVRAGGPRQVLNFFAFEPTVRNGVFVSAADIDGDGVADLAFGGGPGGGPRVRVVDGASLMATRGVQSLDDLPAAGRLYANFVADSALRGGVRVLLRDVDGDGRADVVTGSGAGEAGRVGVLPAGLILGEPTAAVVIEESLYGPGLPDGVYVG